MKWCSENLVKSTPWRALALLAVLALLWVFATLARIMPDIAIVFAWAVAVIVMTSGMYRRRKWQRGAWLAVYFRNDSPVQDWLKGGVLLWSFQFFKALFLGALLLTVLVRTEGPWVWRLLMVTILVLVLVQSVVERRLWRHSSPRYWPELVWRFSMVLTAIIMVALLVVWNFYQSQPDYRGVSLERVFWDALEAERAKSTLLHGALKVLAAWEAIQYWLGQNVPIAWLSKFLIWIFVFVKQALFVVALLVLFNGVLNGVVPRVDDLQ